jgi:hypothetical protein
MPDNILLDLRTWKVCGEKAMKALEHGLHVMIFSDNVPLKRKCELKQYAREHGLLVMGLIAAQPSSMEYRWPLPMLLSEGISELSQLPEPAYKKWLRVSRQGRHLPGHRTGGAKSATGRRCVFWKD